MIWMTRGNIDTICNQMQDMEERMFVNLLRVAKGDICNDWRTLKERINLLNEFSNDLKSIQDLVLVFRRADRDKEMETKIDHLEMTVNGFIDTACKLLCNVQDNEILAKMLYTASQLITDIRLYVVIDLHTTVYELNDKIDKEDKNKSETKQEENNDVRDEGVE